MSRVAIEQQYIYMVVLYGVYYPLFDRADSKTAFCTCLGQKYAFWNTPDDAAALLHA